MATTYFSITFTGANGTAWDTDTVGLALAEGASDPGTIQSNVGQPGVAAFARVYTSRSVTAAASYVASALLLWAAPAVDNLTTSLVLRATADGADGYYVDIDSQAGAPRLRVRRRVAGAYTDVLAWQALVGIVSADLLAGITLAVTVENTTTAVRLIVRINAVDQADFTDSAAARVRAGGRVGLAVPVLAVGTSLLYDTVTVSDLAGENGDWVAPGGAAVPGLREADAVGDLLLVVHGRYMDRGYLRARKIDVLMSRKSWDLQPTIRLRDRNRFHEPLLAHGTAVSVLLAGVTLASGFLRGTTHDANPPEGTEYEVVAAKELAQDVDVLDPRTGTNTVVFNVTDTKSSQYDSTRQNMTIADLIDWLILYMADGDAGLRAVGAAPPSGDVLLAGTTAGLTTVIPNVTLSGDVTRSIEALLKYAPHRGWRIDPATLVWSFPNRATAPTRNIDLAVKHVVGSISLAPKSNFTRVRVTGQPRPAMTTLRLSTGGLSKGWDSATLDGAYSKPKSWRGLQTLQITGAGVDGGTGCVYIDVNASFSAVEAQEWKDAGLRIASGVAAGDYQVRSNTGGATPRFILNRTTWVGSGAPPLPGTLADVGAIGVSHMAGNGYNEAFRAFDITDTLKGMPAAGCYEARIINGDPSGGGAYSVSKVRAIIERKQLGSVLPAQYQTRVVLDTPAVQPMGANVPETEDACSVGNTTIAQDIEIDLPLADLDSDTDLGVVPVPTLLVPTTGFRGSAYSVDPTLWDGGGLPGLGDMGVRRTLPINDPSFDGSAAMVTAYTALADDMLDVLGTLARVGQFRMAGLDTGWADICQRVTLSDSGGRTTGYESAEDLWVIGVEWDFTGAGSTTVYVGTLSGTGGYDIQGVRDEFAARIDVDKRRRDLDEAMRLQECLRNSLAGGYVGAPDPNPIPDCQVSSLDSAGNPGGLSNNRPEKEECLPTWEPLDCTTFLCGIIQNAGQYDMNASFSAATIVDEKTAAFDPGSGKSRILDYVCWLGTSVAALWKHVGDVVSAIENELSKTKTDLGIIRTQTTALKDCVNANTQAISTSITCINTKIATVCAGLYSNDLALQACLAAKLDGPGAACPIPYTCALAPCAYSRTACAWTFTESVCDPVGCPVEVPILVPPTTAP